jgi:polysaccharide export outer membrane protein
LTDNRHRALDYRVGENIMATRTTTSWIGLTICSLSIAFVWGSAPALAQWSRPDPSSEAFSIGPEDVLDISVWGDEGLARVVPVRPDGKISLPLVNDVQAAGLTPMQLRDVLVTRLSEFVNRPQVSVIVREVHSFKVSVLGEVRTPGRYELKSRATVLDVLAQAGGFGDFASRSRIFILRTDGESLKRILFDYKEFVSAEGSRPNFYLHPGDTVVVP